MTEIGIHYRRSRERLAGLLGDAGDEDWRAPVPACPGWTVHDVVGHLLGIVEDVLEGGLTGPPNDEQTTAQVERHRGDRPRAMLGRWAELAPPFEELVTALGVWPAALDVGAHEHDVRGALARPGARDDGLVVDGARQLIRGLDVDACIAFDLGDEVVRSPSRPGPDYTVRTTPFEVFRFRLGRRSAGQVAALDWSRDPGDLVDRLFFFGPAAQPIVE